MNHVRATRELMARIPLGLATLAVLFAGCASRGDLPRTVPVSGKVTYKGQPVEGATVSFIGEGETRTATARTAADGTFHLMTLDAQGAMPGQYTVVVHKMEMPPEPTKPLSMEEAAKLGNQPLPQPKRLLPAKYSDAANSPLKFEVKGGQPNTFDLPLAD
jgi:Carboxypeptidase regulatory-like domain